MGAASRLALLRILGPIVCRRRLPWVSRARSQGLENAEEKIGRFRRVWEVRVIYIYIYI